MIFWFEATFRFAEKDPVSPGFEVFTIETFPLSSCTIVPPCSWLFPPGKLSFHSCAIESLMFFGIVIVLGASAHVLGFDVGSPEHDVVAEFAGAELFAGAAGLSESQSPMF